MRVIERGQHLGLALKRATRSRIVGDTARQDLQRDGAVELLVPRPIHLAHAARAEPAEDRVRTELRPGGEGTCRIIGMVGMSTRVGRLRTEFPNAVYQALAD